MMFSPVSTFVLLILLVVYNQNSACGSVQRPNVEEIDPNLCVKLNTAEADEVTELPGLSFNPAFKQYSGFLPTPSGHNLHYMFVTSQNKPCEEPLVFWFNGGPGCSSLDGLFIEMGPYILNLDGKTLRENPDSWNKYASIVYIESPVGVGYSHSADGSPTVSGDKSTALNNYEAIKQFFARFPLFRRNSVFITGESYSGIYVPTLVGQILDGQSEFPINLEGMAIGNGMLNRPLDTDTMVRYAYAHGLVSETKWRELKMECCGGCTDNCDLGLQHGLCQAMVAEIVRFVWTGGLNPYDLYRDCGPIRSSEKMSIMTKGLLPTNLEVHLNLTIPVPGQQNNEFIKLEGGACNLDESSIISYMNNPEVRRALNIPPTLADWRVCSHSVAAMYQREYSDMTPFVMQALQANLRVLLFYGDTDAVCNFLMGQKFADRLGLRTLVDQQPWHFGGQIGGFKTVYERGLTYLTVRGAGHMVPAWRPAQSDYAFKKFLSDQTI